MIEISTLRRIALALPEAEDRSDDGKLAFSVGGKSFAWTYLVRSKPKAPRQPQLDVLAVRCLLEKKEMLLDAAHDRFFDDDHYRGYPAVLVRLTLIDEDELSALLQEAWRLTAPRAILKRFEP